MNLHLRTRRTRLSAFIAFIVCVALMGGGSRSDILSLVILRPLSIFFAAYAVTVVGWRGVRRIGAPFWFLLAVAVLIGLQLVPLPPAIWQSLPQYDVAARIGEEIGLGPIWRPLALSPVRAWNALFSLSVPFAAMLLYQAQDKADRDRALVVLLIVGVASTVLSLLQITGDPHGPLYLYRVTNSGYAVGFFANRNHQAVFIAAMILVAAWYFRSLDPRQPRAGLKAAGAVGAIILFVPAILLTGSRAGVLIGGLALAAGFFQVRQAPFVNRRLAIGRRSVSGRWLLGAGAAAVLAVFAVAVVSARALALDRLFADEPITNLRGRLLPTLWEMIVEYFPFGSGFGSFEFAYRMNEPEALLGPKYLNEAHNDWVQWLIEGGLPALVILLAFLVWFGRRLVAEFRRDRRYADGRRMMAAQLVILLGIASLFDYPLRVPIMMVFATLACMTLQGPSTRNGFH